MFVRPVQRHRQSRPYHEPTARRGAAIVEFAIVAPLLFMLVLGCIEFGRAMMVSELAISAARTGCRLGVLAGKSNSDITTAVKDFLTEAGLKSGEAAVLVNGNQIDAGRAIRGDKIEVTVSLPMDQNSWLPKLSYLNGATLSGSIVMRRE